MTILQTMRAFPHTLLFKRSSQRVLIEADIKRWVEIRAPERARRSLARNLAWLLDNFPEFRTTLYFRLGAYASRSGRLLLALARFLYPTNESPAFGPCQIGGGLYIEFGFGTIIGPRKIGENCWINSGITIGYKNDVDPSPIIGNNVYIGAGAQVLGPITIGDNVVIGANAVVLRDVPSNCMVAGVPARIIKRNGERVKRFSATSERPEESAT
jgi:serine O-acetyltransferase